MIAPYTRTRECFRTEVAPRSGFSAMRRLDIPASLVDGNIVNLRPESPAFKQRSSEELAAENRRMPYIPRGFAHGFLTLSDNAELGPRWNAPAYHLGSA